MDPGIDAAQIERVLGQLARLRHLADPEGQDALETLRPSWLRPDAWDVMLEDLETQRFRERRRVPRLQLVVG